MSINPQHFAVSILNAIHAPVTHANVASLVGWANAEGGAVHNNPYNTTESAPGATSMNSVGVKVYTNPAEALHATVETLNNGDYGSILSALHSSNPNAFVQAVGGSQWGTSGSLLSGTVHDALGQNYGLTPAERSGNKSVAQSKSQPATTTKSSTITSPGTTNTVTAGGETNYRAAVANALLTSASTPINVDGTLPTTSTLLPDILANVGSGAYTTPTTSTTTKTPGTAFKTIAKTQAGQNAITGKAVNDAAAAGAPADVQHLLKMIHNVNGSPYSTANHDDINERDVNIKAAGTDCSGFVSWLMGPKGLGIWTSSLATPSIDTAPGIEAGKGKDITIWNNSNPGASGHVFIQIGSGKSAQWWASEGGGVGIHQLPLSEVQNYWQNGSDGGHYVALHPKGL